MHHVIPAHRGRPADDPIFALHREASERRARGESIVNATLGTLLDDAGRLVVLPSAARAVAEVPPHEWAAYAPIAGTPEFLTAVVDDLLSGVPALRASATAIATPGGSGALRAAIANFAEPGRAVLTTDYHWGPYATLAADAERTIATFGMFSPDGPGERGAFDVEALDRAIAERTRVDGRAFVLLNDPCHNPTGYSMRAAEWAAVADVVRAHARRAPVTLVVDVAYHAYGARPLDVALEALAPVVAEGAAVLFAWSASKTFTHYGLRVGALVACIADRREREDARSALAYTCRGTWSNCNRGGLVAVTRLLVDRALRDACSREREEAKALLHARVVAFNRAAKERSLRYPPYEGGFFVTVFTPDPRGQAERLRERGVYVVPLEAAGGGGAVRVGICSVATADVPRLVDALAST